MIRRAIFAAFLVCIAAPALAADEKAKTASDQDDPIGRKLSDRIGPYLGPFRPGPLRFLTDAEARDARKQQEAWRKKEGAWEKEYQRLAVDEQVHYCIFQLRNEVSFPGFFSSVPSDEPYSKEPEATASQELVKLGRAAMPQLIRALESRVSTHICWNRWTGEGVLVQDAAFDVIDNIACRFFKTEISNPQPMPKDENERQRLIKKVHDWWEKNKDSDERQWAKEVLFSEKAVDGGSRHMAIDSLYRRLGKESYPLFIKAYQQLPKGQEKADPIYETKWLKVQIVRWLLKNPTNAERPVFASALQDSELWVQIDGAHGLWAIGDRSGLEALAKETEERLLKDIERPSAERECEYDNLFYFLCHCDTPSSREAIYKCLRGQNPYLRERAIRSVPSLRMEKAVRALPDLFDDHFVLEPSSVVNEVRMPILRVCDAAAHAFAKVVPDAPRFAGFSETARTWAKVAPESIHFAGCTDAEKQACLDKMKQWWKENGSKLKWDDKRGMLVLSKKE